MSMKLETYIKNYTLFTFMLLKFAYDGIKFFGYQRQKDVPTVEGEILKILKKFKIARNIRSASRTDRGVSALGNVIQIESSMDPKRVVGILNSNLKYIYFHSFALEDINPRYAELRWYRYHLLNIGYDLDRLKEAAKIFQGKHDFINFTRARKNTTLEIRKIEVDVQGDLITIDFYAQNYLWNLIRRIVAAMEKYALGLDFGEEVFERRMNFGIAPPEPLILMDIMYNFEFTPVKMKEKRRREISIPFLQSLLYYYLSQGVWEKYKSFKLI